MWTWLNGKISDSPQATLSFIILIKRPTRNTSIASLNLGCIIGNIERKAACGSERKLYRLASPIVDYISVPQHGVFIIIQIFYKAPISISSGVTSRKHGFRGNDGGGCLKKFKVSKFGLIFFFNLKLKLKFNVFHIFLRKAK